MDVISLNVLHSTAVSRESFCQIFTLKWLLNTMLKQGIFHVPDILIRLDDSLRGDFDNGQGHLGDHDDGYLGDHDDGHLGDHNDVILVIMMLVILVIMTKEICWGMGWPTL